MGAYAELRGADKFEAQLGVADMDCASLARSINAHFGTPAKPQVTSRQFLSQLKNGKKKRCTPALAEAICSVLGVARPMLFDVHGLHNDVGQSAA